MSYHLIYVPWFIDFPSNESKWGEKWADWTQSHKPMMIDLHNQGCGSGSVCFGRIRILRKDGPGRSFKNEKIPLKSNFFSAYIVNKSNWNKKLRVILLGQMLFWILFSLTVGCGFFFYPGSGSGSTSARTATHLYSAQGSLLFQGNKALPSNLTE